MPKEIMEHHEIINNTAEVITKHTSPAVGIVATIFAWVLVGVAFCLDSILTWHIPPFIIDVLKVISILLACTASIYAIIASRKTIKNNKKQ